MFLRQPHAKEYHWRLKHPPQLVRKCPGVINVKPSTLPLPWLSTCSVASASRFINFRYCLSGCFRARTQWYESTSSFLVQLLSCLISYIIVKKITHLKIKEVVLVSLILCRKLFFYTRWFKYDRDYLCVNKSQFVPVIFEPPCILGNSGLYFLISYGRVQRS
jgi:hypothetical protein